MRITDKFKYIKTDLSPIGLIKKDTKRYKYFCTPKNAVVFAGIGVDGIHFCILPDENDKTLENSPVYVVSPMMPDHYVEPVAENFYNFISLVVLLKDAGALEYISYADRAGFSKYLQDVPCDKQEIIKAVTALSDAFPVKNINDAYGYVKQLQSRTDLPKIEYTEEYYELTGREK
jgi:hypothetical protein